MKSAWRYLLVVATVMAGSLLLAACGGGGGRDEGPTPAGGEIAFHFDGNGDIYGMNADGSGQMRLVQNPESDRDPDWQRLGHAPSLAASPGATPFALATGWNYLCYLGPEQPIEDALGDIVGDVQAVYRLSAGQTFDTWFPETPGASNITTVSSYEPLFVLMAGDAAWPQTPSDTPPPSVDLGQGWNSVCYLGQNKAAESATQGIATQLAVLYTLGADQAWSIYVPGQPEVSNIAQLEQYEAVLMLVTEGGGGIWPEFAVSAGPNERTDPAISGNIVVWNEERGQDWDIRGYDLSTQTEFSVTIQEEDQLFPAVSGNIVVWQDERNTLPRIYGYDLTTKQEFPVTAESSPQFYPDISGNIVVFRDWRKTGECSWSSGGGPFSPPPPAYCDWDIWGADLDSGAEFPICTESGVQRPPRVSGNTVVWSERLEDDEWAIYSSQLDSAAQPVRIAAIPSKPDLEIDGNIVVWEEGNEILGYHLLSRSEFHIATGSGGKDEPDISGNIVVWADKRSGDWDIYGYDVAFGKEFPISTAPGDQVEPAIHGDVVVWVDERNSSTEIYGARLPSINEEQTQQVVPAPTPTPTPTPTPAPTPISGSPAPVLISPIGGITVDPNNVVFRWTPVEGAIDYSLRWQECPHGPGLYPGDLVIGLRTTEYAPPSPLEPGITYCWAASARHDYGSVESEEETFYTSP